MADNFENIAQKEFLLENSPRVELASMQNDIRSSMETQKEVGNLSQFLPKDFNPSNDYFFGKSVASPLKPTLETRNYNIEDAYAQLPSGDYLAKYDTFKSGRDNAEYAAATQTTGEKWANGATKALAKTGSAVIGGTVGLIYGVGAALKDGSFTAIYDNSFSNTLADWDEKLQYQLPNYYSKQEQEKGLFGQMGTANFWSDKFLGGLSFTAGAIISEAIWAYATGGLSLAAEGAMLGTRLARAGKWGVEALGETAALQGVSKFKGLYNTMLQGSIDAAKMSKTLPNALGKAGELASSIGVLARSAGYEASVEALQYKREAMENFHQNFLAMNGREPNSEELSAFKSNLESSANAVFGANMAILMPSNLVTMGHILDIKSPIKTGFAEFIDKRAFGYGIGKTVDTAGKETFKVLEATTKQKIVRTAYNYVLKPAFSEGLFEEGLQGVTTKTANKWIEHTYNPRYANDTLDSMGAFYESLGEQYGTKEGWVENGLGMIIGIVGGATNAKAEQRQKAEELSYQEAVANTLNENFLQRTILPNRVQSASREAGFSEDAKIEAQKGNMNRASLAQQSALLTYVNAKMSLGETIPDIVKSVKMGLDSTTEDQWKEAGISPDQIDNHKEESLKEFEQLAKDWKTNKTYWGYIIGNKIKGEQFLDTQIAEGMFGGVQGAPAIIEALAWQSTIGSSANKQMKEVQDAISKELGIEAASALKTNEKLTAATIQTKRQIHLDTVNYKAELKKRDTLVKKIERLNHAPQRPEGRDAESGRQAGILSQSLLETEEKLQNLEAALEEHAKELSKTEAYQKEIGAVDFSSQDLSTDIITGSDLISLTDNLKKLTSTLETMKTVNPQRATYLEEMFKEYSDSQEVFLQNQLSQRLVLHPDFKIEQINSWIQSKLKKNAKMNVNTQDWLTDTLETYKRIKTEGLKEQAEVKLGERKEEIQRELDTIEDKNSDRAKEIQAELDSYNKSEVEKDKKEVVVKSREQQIQEDINKLETEKQQKLSEVQSDITIENVDDFNNLTNEQRTKLKEQAKKQIDTLPDDMFFLIHLTPTRENLDGIIKNGLTTGVAIESTTNVNTTKEGLYKSVEAIIDGKVKHRGSSNLAIIGFPNNINTQGLPIAKNFSDIVMEHLMNNHPEDVNKKIPAQYNIATFSNGQVHILGEAATVSQNEKSKEAINKKYDSQIEALKNELAGKAPSQLEVYKKRIEQALQKGHNYLSYLGDNYDDVANKKPTEAEVEEFIKLRGEKKFLDPRYKELQQKLSDWKLLDSAVDEDYVSIGDLILAVEQLEQQVEEEETRTEVTPEDTPDISDNESIQASENVTRYDMLQNTNAGITVKRRKNGNFSLHHLKLSNIAQRMGFDPSVDSLVNKEGKGITFGEETSGSILTVDGVEFKVTGGNAIEVKESDFIPLQQRLNMYVLNTGAVKWSYSDVYTQVGDDFVKMESDFRDDSINAERIYDLKEGDRLTITVNNEDGYNDKLLKEYETAKGKAKDEALKKLKANLKLSATTVDGVIENVSTLKAMRAEIDEDFMRLRERAFELYMEAADKNNVKLGIEVTVSGSFLGSPNFTITDNTISNIAITKRASEEIIATGFIENGEFTLNREVKDVNKTYVGQLSKKNKDKKVPVIVFKRGVHSVAFPVTMNKTDNDLSSLFDSILGMKISNQEKVRKINAEIQANKINTPKLVYEDVYNNKKLEDTRKAFSEVKSFVTAEEFADKNYNIENTIKDISINIDLENISSIINSPKLKINLDNSVKYTTDLELKHGSMTDLENEIDKIARELYNDYTKNAQTKYTKANGDIVEDTGYTDTFDDNPIEPATNQLDKIKNINILRTAFEGLTPALKKIIGKENIDKVNEMFKQYDFIKSQLTPKSNTINNGKNNTKCP